MVRTVLIYAPLLGLLAVSIHWLETLVMGHRLSSGGYMVIIAIGFAVLGGWIALQLMGRTPSSQGFERNSAAIASLGLTQRECLVLKELAEGYSYKEIARTLDLSPNTVKTHVSNIYRKLETDRRTHAVAKARMLAIIP